MDKKKLILTIYAMLQVVVLIFLRKIYLMTVYQTAVFYLFVCLVGIFVLFSKKTLVRQVQHVYLLLWSSIHGIIVLGFLTKGTFYLTLTQLNVIQVINIFLGFVLYWGIYLLSGRCETAIGIGNVLIGVMGVTNRYLVRFRGAPFRISDIMAARTAGNVAQNYDFTPDIYMVAAVLDLIIWHRLMRRVILETQGDLEDGKDAKVGRIRRVSPWNLVITGTTAVGCLMLLLGDYQSLYARTGQFAEDNYLAELLADTMGSVQNYPEDYSAGQAEQIFTEYEETCGGKNKGTQTESAKSVGGQQPNIVVIMNEAFSDLRVLGNVETDAPFLSYWDSLDENCIRGWLNVSVLGGTTANSEYEFLTSDAVALYSGGDVIPYNQYFDSGDSYPGLVSTLEAQGYETTVFHPYLSSGWNRTQVYRAMQFQHIIFQEDLEEKLDTLRLYVSDKGDYDYIQQWFTEKEAGVPQFFFNVTMQNHGGYTYDESDFETTVHLSGDAAGRFPRAEQYLSLIKASDEALEGLLRYFEDYDEPVIVVMFGDHQPNLETEFYSYITGEGMDGWSTQQRACQYKTPFLIWHNYDTEYQNLGDVSANYLASVLLQDAGLSMSEYQQYLLDKRQELPVVNGIGVWDDQGNLYARGSEEYHVLTEDMQTLVYNHTVDKEGRVERY